MDSFDCGALLGSCEQVGDAVSGACGQCQGLLASCGGVEQCGSGCLAATANCVKECLKVVDDLV